MISIPKYVANTTKAQGLPRKVSDKDVLHAIAAML